MRERSPGYIGSVVLAVAMVFFTSQQHLGFMLIFWLLPFSIWLIYSIVVMVRHRNQVRRRAIRIGVWAAAFFCVAAIHFYWAKAARADANEVVAAVLAHKERTGIYPQSFDEMGLSKFRIQRKWMLGYLLDKGDPFVVYGSTFAMFDTYTYNFKTSRWEYNPD